MSSEEWHRKIPFTGYLQVIGISVPVVDSGSVRRGASSKTPAENYMNNRLLRDLEDAVEFLAQRRHIPPDSAFQSSGTHESRCIK